MSHYKKHSTFEIQPSLGEYKRELEQTLDDMDEKFPGVLDRSRIKADDLPGSVLDFPITHDPEISLDYLENNLGFTQEQIKVLVDEDFLVLVDDEDETTLDKVIHDLKEGGDTTMVMYIDENYQDTKFAGIIYQLVSEVESGLYDGVLDFNQKLKLIRLTNYMDAIKDLNEIDSFLKELE